MYQVLQPPSDEKLFAERGKEIVAAAKELGMKLNTEGFLLAWLNGTRVLVERDSVQAIVALCLMAVGKRWATDDFTATVMELRGNNPVGMMDFATQVASALGATSLFHQPEEGVEENGRRVHRVIELKLQ